MKPLKQAVYSSRSADKFVVRLSDGLRQRISTIAAAQHRSMNSQMLKWLEMCTELTENNPNFTDEDLKAAFAESESEVNPSGVMISCADYPIIRPAPGMPVTIKSPDKYAVKQKIWIVREYAVRGDVVIAILAAPNLKNVSAVLDVNADDLVPA